MNILGNSLKTTKMISRGDKSKTYDGMIGAHSPFTLVTKVLVLCSGKEGHFLIINLFDLDEAAKTGLEIKNLYDISVFVIVAINIYTFGAEANFSESKRSHGLFLKSVHCLFLSHLVFLLLFCVH
jgi:hypothetical protein